MANSGGADSRAVHDRVNIDHPDAKPPGTPLDGFFRSYTSFPYDPALPPATSFAQLRDLIGWRRGDRISSEAWNTYQDSLKAEVQLWVGEEDDLHAWHTLCRAIGITHPPHNREGCAKTCIIPRFKMDDPDISIARSSNTRKYHQFDPMASGRRLENAKVQTFPNVRLLRGYTVATGKRFRNPFDEDDSNVVLRHLLRGMFQEEPARRA